MGTTKKFKRGLKPLRVFNKERSAMYVRYDIMPHQNGIACPECGNSLYDSNPNKTVETYPPQKDVHCEACRYVGLRIA